MLNKYAKYGEPMQFIVLASFLPVMVLFEAVKMPKGAILAWAIPAIIIATIGTILNGRHIELESQRRTKEFNDMVERHKKMLGDK